MKTEIKKSCTLYEGVKSLQDDLSNNTCKNWIKTGRISVNGITKRDPRLILKAGDFISLGSKKLQLYPGVEILYQDDDCIVVTKPSGLLAVDSLDPTELSLHALLKANLKPSRVYPVQRLDEGTSGVMIFALNRAFKDSLKEQFEKHTITREYYALVTGILKKPSGRWKNLLREDKQYFVHVVDSNGEEAITDYELLAEKNGVSLINFKLHTGRKNQIRVQSAFNNLPIVGDIKYGKEQALPAKRLMLHAHTLGFYHPYLKKNLSFNVPAPFSLDSFKSV